MKKLLLTNVFLTLCAIVSWANPVDKQMAAQKARQFVATRLNAPVPQLTLAFQGRQKTLGEGKLEQDAYYYIFNKGNHEGYVVMSGDDVAAAVLGYADKGSFDPNNIPPNMKEWLDGYARQIAWGRQNSPAAKGGEEETVPQEMRTVISPLVETHWGQDEPYNLKCFTTGGSQAVTGCVATALAQVMYYHKWPQEATTAIPAYDSWGELPATTFDWDNMKLSYSGKETLSDPSAAAVSQLLYYCGHAVRMSYGTSASSASTSLCAMALNNYFGYENSCQNVSRESFTKVEWEKLLYEELINGRPVIYSGRSKQSGHAFICDGYDGYGLFHINWGWMGMSDGYFRLQALNPYAQGTGGSKSGYAFSQSAIIGISPTVVNNNEVESKPEISLYNFAPVDGDEVSMSYSGETFDVAVNFSFTVEKTATYDMSIALYRGDELLQLQNLENGSEYQENSGVWTYSSINLYYLGANLMDGTYIIKPVFRESGTEEWIPLVKSDMMYIKAVISSGTVTFTLVKDFPTSLLSFVSLEEIGGGSDTKKLRLTMRNDGEKDFGGNVYLYVNDVNADYEWMVVGTGEVDFADFTFSNSSTEPVSLVFKDDSGTILYQGSFTFKTSDGSSSAALPTVVAYGMNNIDVDEKKMYVTTASAWVTLNNETEEDYVGKLILNVSKYSHTDDEGSVWSYPYSTEVEVSLPKGQSGDFKIEYPGWSIGDELWFSLYLDDEFVSSYGWAYSRYVVTEAYTEWDSKGTVVAVPITNNITVSSNAVAADLTNLDLTKVTVKPNANPNTIYYFAANATIPTAFSGKNVVKGYKANGNISFVNGYDFYVPITFNVSGQVSYTLTPSAECNGYKGWTTMALPFGVQTVTSNNSVVKWTTPGSSSEADFWVKRLDNMEGDVATFEDAASWAPNQPYLIGVPKSFLGHPLVLKSSNTKVLKSDVSKMVGGGFEFIGTTGSASLGQAYVMNALGNGFVRTSDATVSAGTAYFNAVGDASSVELIRIGGLRGDVNGDGVVGVTDVMTMVDYLLGLKPEVFIRSNAEMNNDSRVSVADVFGVVDMILLK